MVAGNTLIDEVIVTLRTRVGTESGISASWKYDLGPDGHIFIDTKTVPHAIAQRDAPADCVITVALPDLRAMLAGEMDSTTAFTQGKLRLSGNMGIVIKIDAILGTSRAAQG